MTAYFREAGERVIWTGVTWLSDFPGSSCGLNFFRLVLTFQWISPQSDGSQCCFNTLSWQCTCWKPNCPSACALYNEAIFMSRMGSYGNRNPFAERLISHVGKWSALESWSWVVTDPTTCACCSSDSWFGRAYHSPRVWIFTVRTIISRTAPRGMLEPTSLEICKMRLDRVLCNVSSAPFSTKAWTRWSLEVPSLLILWRFSLVLLAWRSNVKIQQISFWKTDEQGSNSQGFMSNQCIIPSSLFNFFTSL